MKKLLLLFLITALTVCLCAAYAEGNNPFVGTWELIRLVSEDSTIELTGENAGYMYGRFVFNEDCTFSQTERMNGQYSYVDGVYEIVGEDSITLSVNEQIVTAFFHFEGDTLVLTEEENGGIALYFQREITQKNAESTDIHSSDMQVHAEGGRWEGPGFDTPEDAVLYYLDGLKTQDLDKMLGAFAWESKLEHSSIRQQIERYGVYSSSTNPLFPTNDGIAGTIMLERYRSQILDSITRSFMAYLAYGQKAETVMQGLPIGPLKTDEDIRNVINSFDMSRLDKLITLDNIQFILPNMATNGQYSDSRIQANIEKDRIAYGADELIDRVAFFTIDGENYFFACSVSRFGDRWYLYSVPGYVGNIMGIDANQRAFGRYPKW